MRLKPFGTIISVAVAALAVYVYYVLGGSMAGMIIGGAGVLISALLCMGVALPQARTSALSSVVSALLLFVFIALNIVTVLFSFSTPLTLILNAGLLIIYAIMLRGLWSAAQ